MNARDFLLVALPAALVGAGLGYLFAAVDESAPRTLEAAPPRAVSRPRPAPTPALDASGAELVTPSTESARVTASTAPAGVSEEVLARALETVTAPDASPRQGTGAITGQVVDGSGAPLEGAVVIGDVLSVRHAMDPADIGGAAPVEERLDEFLREQARSWAETRAGRRRAVTGADGRFRLASLDPGASYHLGAYVEDYVAEPDGTAYSVSPGQTVNFRLRRVHAIPVELVFENGQRANEGVIGVTRGDDHELFSWSAREPVLRLTRGRVGVRGYTGLRQSTAWRQGVDSTHGSEEVSLDVVDHAGQPLRLVLKARVGLRGRVIDEAGLAGSNRLMVRLLPVAADGEVDEKALAESDRYSWASGDRYDFLDLTPGVYAVGLANWNQALLVHEVVTVGAGVMEVDLVVPAPDPEKHLLVRAFGPSGNPLEDLEFRWMHRREGGSSSGGLQGRRAPDGAYWLLPKAEFFEAWPAETSYTLTVQHSELGAREVQLEEGQREVDLTFEEPVALVVVVTRYAGSGYEGKLEVGLTKSDEDDSEETWQRAYRSRSHRQVTFSADGVARYDNLAPGTWVVDLIVKTGDRRTQLVQSAEVRVRSGEKRVELELPALYDLTVVATGLAANARVWLRRTDETDERVRMFSHHDARLDDDGRALFTGLLAGRYELSGRGAEPVEVVVPSGDVYLEAREDN